MSGAIAWRQIHLRNAAEDISNFRLVFEPPPGWRSLPHSPQTLFLFRNDRDNLMMRGAASDIVAEFNPTPELDRDGLAKLMLDITDHNLKGWQGKLLGTIDSKNITFRLVRRWCKEKCVITAVAVRGNTSFLVTLSGDQRKVERLDHAFPAFQTYIASLATEKRFYAE
jgi:hypothetical protein